MILYEETGEKPLAVSMNGMPPQAMRQKLVTHKISSDEDMTDFHKEMAKGRDIVVQVEGKDCIYIMTRELIPSKIALGGLPPEGGKQ